MKSKISHTMKPSFRVNATSGTWCCLLLPTVYLSVIAKDSRLDVSSLLLAIFTGLYSCCSAQKILASSAKSAIDGRRKGPPLDYNLKRKLILSF
jgi:hypothetical protein